MTDFPTQLENNKNSEMGSNYVQEQAHVLRKCVHTLGKSERTKFREKAAFQKLESQG